MICADTSNIDTVFVAGRIVKQDGQLIRVDLQSLLRRLDNARDYLLSTAGDSAVGAVAAGLASSKRPM